MSSISRAVVATTTTTRTTSWARRNLREHVQASFRTKQHQKQHTFQRNYSQSTFSIGKKQNPSSTIRCLQQPSILSSTHYFTTNRPTTPTNARTLTTASSTSTKNHDPPKNDTCTTSSFPPPPLRAYPRQYPRPQTVPSHIPRPPYADSGQIPVSFFETITLHDHNSIDQMRAAAQLARTALNVVLQHARPGVTTEELDILCHNFLIQQNAYPSPLNYAGFPKSLCSSINEVICHGIPDSRPLQYGDVVAFDVSCFLNGVHGDNCATMIVGDTDDDDDTDHDTDTITPHHTAIDTRAHWETDDEPPTRDWRGVPYKSLDRRTSGNLNEPEHFRQARRLVRATRESLYAAIETCRPGSCLSEIGHAIHAVADKYGYESVEKYRGHGIGREFHCAPYVKHYRNRDRLTLEPGMIFTIEPMLVMGRQHCFEWEDGWTVATYDGSLAAQFEHTVLITEEGVEILTVPMKESPKAALEES